MKGPLLALIVSLTVLSQLAAAEKSDAKPPTPRQVFDVAITTRLIKFAKYFNDRTVPFLRAVTDELNKVPNKSDALKENIEQAKEFTTKFNEFDANKSDKETIMKHIEVLANMLSLPESIAVPSDTNQFKQLVPMWSDALEKNNYEQYKRDVYNQISLFAEDTIKEMKEYLMELTEEERTIESAFIWRYHRLQAEKVDGKKLFIIAEILFS